MLYESIFRAFYFRVLGFFVLSAFIGASTNAHATTVCGPGPHWVDVCAPASQTWLIRLEFGLDRNLDSIVDEEAFFEGYAVVQNGAPFESDPAGDPGHLDRINTQIVDMYLNGVSSNVAGWVMRAGATQGLAVTNGFIQEDLQGFSDPTVATNRFNMVFEIDGTPDGTLHHDGTFFFTEDLESFPAIGADYGHLGGPFGTSFPLYDASNTHVATIKDLFNSDHATTGRPHFQVTAVIPLPSAAILLGSGLCAMLGGAVCRRRVWSCVSRA